jgi:hypothetical protein
MMEMESNMKKRILKMAHLVRGLELKGKNEETPSNEFISWPSN